MKVPGKINYGRYFFLFPDDFSSIIIHILSSLKIHFDFYLVLFSDAPAKVVLGPIPTDFVLKNDYYTDCQQVVDHMRYAVQMEKGNNKLAEVAQKTKDEMSEFVSFYRRFNVGFFHYLV